VTSLTAALLLSALAEGARAQTTIVGDAYVTGQMSVGTNTVSGPFFVLASSGAATVFQVSGVDETPFLTVASSGAVGVGATPVANLDVNGSGDSGVVALQLRDGNMYPATGSYQVAFGVNGSSNLRHAIRTTHSTSTLNNSIDFFLWTPAVSTPSVGSLEVLSLVTTSTGASMHIMPVSVSTVEVTVSNGVTLGGGSVIRAIEGPHSSRELKSDITYLGPQDEARAYAEVAALKHATYRYKVWRKGKLVSDDKQPLRRGLIYEDAPDSVKGPGATLVYDERLNNAELAAKELIRRLESLESKASALDPGGKP
jgi:hypothetical protein